MPTLSIDQVQAQLPQLIDQLQPGEAWVITRGETTIARLVPEPPPKGTPVYGRGKGRMALDVTDKSHLDDFEEYMF